MVAAARAVAARVAAAAAAAAREAAAGGWLWVSVVNLVWFVDLAVEQDGLEEPEHGGEEAHHLGLLDNRRRGVAQPGHGGQGKSEEQMRVTAPRQRRDGRRANAVGGALPPAQVGRIIRVVGERPRSFRDV